MLHRHPSPERGLLDEDVDADPDEGKDALLTGAVGRSGGSAFAFRDGLDGEVAVGRDRPQA